MKSRSGYFIRLHQDGLCSIIAIYDDGSEEVYVSGVKREVAELELYLATGEVWREKKGQLEFDL